MKNKKIIISIIVMTIVICLLFFALKDNYDNGLIFNFGEGKLKFVILGALAIVLILFIIIYKIAFKSYDFYDGNDEAIDVSFKEIEEKSKELLIGEYSRNYKDNIEITKEELVVSESNETIVSKEEINTEVSNEILETNDVASENEETALDGENINEEVSDIEETNESRFYMLTQIDRSFVNYEKPEYNDDITLEELCNTFRNFACNRLKLYYDISDIRRFIAGLSVTKILILQGMSGTGKTSLAYAFGEFLNNKTVVVPIQPMWKERTDLIGYYNEFTRKFNETTLLYKMYEANYNDNIYITVLDEMNIARVEYYFAEFLSLLELPNPEGRNLDVVSDVWSTDPKLLRDGKLRLPINMWFIGTANNDDSTFSISDKVYDRAMVLNLDKKADVFEAEYTETEKISTSHLQELFKKAQKEYSISDRNLRRIEKFDKYLMKTFHITFGNRIMKQIQAYVPVLVACGGTELEGLDDILSRKVLRKLESKNPVYVKAQSEELINMLDDIFGVDKMPLCKEVVYNIEQNA